MIYSYMLDKNYRGSTVIKSSEEIMNEEYKAFSNIAKSINCLTENGIMVEGIDFKAVGEKIRTYWKKFVTWFREHIVKFFKDLWQKIVNSKVGQAFAKLKSKKNPKVEKLEFKPGNTEAPKEVEESVSITEASPSASRKDLQLKIMIEKSIVPELYFRLDEFLDVNKLNTCINDIIENSRKAISMVEEKNPKTDNQMYKYTSSKAFDEINAKGKQIEEDLKDAVHLDIESVNNVSDIIDSVHEKLKSRVQDSMSYQSLVSLIETNTKNANTEIKQLSTIIMTIDKFCNEFDQKLANGISSSGVFTMIKDAVDMFRFVSSTLSAYLNEIKAMYQKSMDILKNLILLNEIL